MREQFSVGDTVRVKKGGCCGDRHVTGECGVIIEMFAKDTGHGHENIHVRCDSGEYWHGRGCVEAVK
jgi:hypothetical protein